jgi:hypothetical protein
MTTDPATPPPAPDAPPAVTITVGGERLFPRDDLRLDHAGIAEVPFALTFTEDGGPTTLRGAVTFDAVGLAAVAQEVFVRVLAALQAAAKAPG